MSDERKSPFADHAYAVLSGTPRHVAAPALLECIGCAGAEGGTVVLDSMPAAASLSPEGREWIKETLVLCGFELQPDGSLRASDDTLDQLRSEQNTARRQVHADAAVAREALLTAQLKALSAVSSDAAAVATTLGLARAGLRDFLSAFDGQPAAGPFLLGVAALLRTQALSSTATAHQWRLERAAVLNGGDEFVRRAVPLLRELGLRCCGDAGDVDLEGGNGADDDTIIVEVTTDTWTAGLAAIGQHEQVNAR